MAGARYPVRVRIDRSPRSSRVWALLTITLVKFIALLPHALALFLLGLAVFVVFVIAQVLVLARGTYPRPLFEFVAGVLRWQVRVYAFALSLTDRYPPFSLAPRPDFPVDIEVIYPQRSNPWLASLTLAGLIFWLLVVLPLGWSSYGTIRSGSLPALQPLDLLTNLRFFALLPHFVVIYFYFFAALIVFAVGQVLILATGSLPEGMHEFIAGWVRWLVRTWAWLYGLVDRYPPFTTEDTEPLGQAPPSR